MRDTLIPAHLRWSNVSQNDVRNAIHSYYTEKNGPNKEKRLEELILLLLLLVIGQVKVFNLAIQRVITELYGIVPPSVDVQSAVARVAQKYWPTIKRAIEEDHPGVARMLTGAIVAEATRRIVTTSLLATMALMENTRKGAPDELVQVVDRAVERGAGLSDEEVIGAVEPVRMVYIYEHTNHLEGICWRCLPWVGTKTYGDGTDGVPIPPQHLNCKCVLVPAGVAGEEEIGVRDPVMELRKVRTTDLSKVLGPVRAKLVIRGKVSLDDLFTDDYSRLKTLDELGYSMSGTKR